MLATVHVQPAWSIAAAAVVAGWIAWYWWRLGQAQVPQKRRDIRRTSLVFMTLALVAIVTGLSFIDPMQQQREYIMIWTAALVFILLVMIAAGLDAIHTLRTAQQQNIDALRDAASELAEAIQQRKREDASAARHPSKRNGEIT